MNREKIVYSEMPVPGPWQIVILLLSIYVLLAILVETACTLSPETVDLLWDIDTLICFVFIGDFFWHLFRARDKMEYLKWGWIDLISSIPNIHYLRVGRIARVIRVLRILRAVRSTHVIFHYYFTNRKRSIFASITVIWFALLISSSITILNIETTPEANVKNAGDALWWAFNTIVAGGGYGNYFPLTASGKILAGFLMIAGMVIFGIFTALLASKFVEAEYKDFQEEYIESEAREDVTERMILEELKRLREEVAELKKAKKD
ncbi:MAG: ion transporter [Candidatus Wallbacteria bacterium]|nr:ion transporter [Candidatus Wallbacteria bacterium]